MKDRKLQIINILKHLPLKPFFSPFYSGIGSILFMHKVINEDRGKQRISLMRANELESGFLEEMLIRLKKKYDFISLDELYLRLKTKTNNNKKFIAISFDDGYKDNLKLAYPILKKLNIPFIIYITNSFPNSTAKLWWYMLEDILLENDEVIIRHKDKKAKFLTKTQDQKDKSFNKIRNIIISATKDEGDELIFDLERRYNKELKAYVQKEALTWDEIKFLSEDPIVTIGCHTMNHLALNTLSDTEILDEVNKSKEEIENQLEKKVNHFAFPYGTSNEIGFREINLIKDNNLFLTATTTRMGNIFSKHKRGCYALPRIQVLGDQQDFLILEMYLCGLLPAIKNKFKRAVMLY